MEQALDAFFYVREYFELKKKPSTSELLDWIGALRLSAGCRRTDSGRDLPLLSFLIKKDEDLEDGKTEHRRPSRRTADNVPGIFAVPAKLADSK